MTFFDAPFNPSRFHAKVLQLAFIFKDMSGYMKTAWIKRVEERFGGVLCKASTETPSLFKYYLRQPPLTAARMERGEKSH